MTTPPVSDPPQGGVVLILGSAPDAPACRAWPRGAISTIVALNNAWQIRPDWDHLVVPEDFPAHRYPPARAPAQSVIGADRFVPANNRFGGILYAGGTMAFTAAYWALAELRPRVLAFFGCDMVYDPRGKTHFYGQGSADPLRADISLRSLEAKAARLGLFAAAAGCTCVRLSQGHSRLTFPATRPDSLANLAAARRDPLQPGPLHRTALQREDDLGYRVASGRYWTEAHRFDPAEIDALDALWVQAAVETPDSPGPLRAG